MGSSSLCRISGTCGYKYQKAERIRVSSWCELTRPAIFAALRWLKKRISVEAPELGRKSRLQGLTQKIGLGSVPAHF